MKLHSYRKHFKEYAYKNSCYHLLNIVVPSGPLPPKWHL